ncbi:hypothetical protein HPB50_000110 [Hyalomma asiaticum]|uniref:Uncharacterized protein n=1 Tax=Hyalomma asiaticum TaxID=266040 RepID=A0ACB7SRD8_HYAAI|nr:hypothetical protein HPB50_000110 [Hyalomma asiaticum]
MKACVFVTLVALFAVAYAETDALGKAGKALETVGRLLQGEDVAMSEEVQEDLIKALRVASNDGEVLSEDGNEYILPIIVRGVVRELSRTWSKRS